MYDLLVSDGVVLGKYGAGEANTVLAVLTREAGLLRASARSSRTEVSKLRYGLQTLQRGRFSFVRGKREWKLVGVDTISHELLSSFAKNRQAAGRIAKLFLRLVQGEEPVPALYPDFLDGLTALAKAASSAEVESIECILVLRTLAHLGYLAHTPELAPFIEGDFLSAELSQMVARSRSLLFRTINQSLEATGL